MVWVVNLDRKEYLYFDATLAEVSGTSAQAFMVFYLLSGQWAGQRVTIYEKSSPSLDDYMCINI